MVAMVTLDQVREGAAPDYYPRHAIVGGNTALILFAAAFYGQQDAIWFAEAGVTATCVDTDGDRLGEMQDAYPDDWKFVNADAFEFSLRTSGKWDVVSIDCPSPMFDRCAELLPLWCRMANRTVILGSGRKMLFTDVAGWKLTDSVFRSHNYGGVYWRVFEPIRDPLEEGWAP